MTRLAVMADGWRPNVCSRLAAGVAGPAPGQRWHGGGLIDGMARILHPDGGELMLPGYTGYDVEFLLEYSQWCAHRYGEVWLELASRAWLINALSGRTATCIGCHERRANLCFNDGGGDLQFCTRCAQEELQGNLRR